MTTTTPQSYALVLVLLATNAGCGDANPVNTTAIDVTDAKTARKAFVDHLSKHGTDIGTNKPADYDIEVKPFSDSIWLVYATPKLAAVDETALFIVESDSVREATLRNLIYAHAQKFPASSDEKGRFNNQWRVDTVDHIVLGTKVGNFSLMD